MKYHLTDSDDDINCIREKLIRASLDNIRWSCNFSGMGILQPLNEKNIEKLSKSFDMSTTETHLINNYVPICCIYKKGKPAFTNPPAEIINPGRYMWDFASFDKTINLASQAFSILSLCRSAEVLYNVNKFEGALMLRTAFAFYNFMSTYLRNDDGLYVSAEDKTRYFNDELKIKTDLKSERLIDQVYAFEALLYLYKVTSDPEITEYFSSKSDKYLKDAKSIFEYVFLNFNLLLELNSKEISYCISSLSRCSTILKESDRDNIKYLIALLCAELESRIKITGEVERNCGEMDNASFITHIRVASSLVEGFIETKIDKFNDLALRVFDSLHDFFDSTLGLYVFGDYKHITYSIRDIAEVLKTLALISEIEVGVKPMEMLKLFYKTSLECTGIIQAVSDRIIGDPETNISFPDNIPFMDDIMRAPVFLKSFRINSGKKSMVCTTSKYFNSAYANYASYLILFYL